MSEETLRELLARVHERLNTSGSVDADAREMLSTVMRDIDSALGRGATSVSPVNTTAAIDAKVATAPRLEAVAVRFETEHPAIAQLLRQIGTLLGQAGI